MNLVLLFDHRFHRNARGRVFSLKGYDYEFFATRYLGTFDRVRILARVVCAPSDRPDVRLTEGPGIEVRSLGDWNGPEGFLAAARAVMARLHAAIPSSAAVVMIVPGMVGGLAYGSLLRRRRPYAVEVAGDPHDVMAPGAMRHPLRPVLRWFSTRQLRRQCAGAVAASYVTREVLQRRYPCRAYSVGVSDVALHERDFAPAPRPPRSAAQHTLITVGTLAQLYKAPEVLIDATAACVSAGLDLALVVVGDGRHRPELEARAAALGIGKRVCFHGNLTAGEAVRAALDRADLFVLPSRQEGLPRAMVEAMARGLPCIGSTVGGIPELLPVDDLVSPNDIGALAGKIREVVTAPSRMARMSARNLETAAEYREHLLHGRRSSFHAEVRRATAAWRAC